MYQKYLKSAFCVFTFSFAGLVFHKVCLRANGHPKSENL